MNRLYNLSPKCVAKSFCFLLQKDIIICIYRIESIKIWDGCPPLIRFKNSFYPGGLHNHINLPYIWELYPHPPPPPPPTPNKNKINTC